MENLCGKSFLYCGAFQVQCTDLETIRKRLQNVLKSMSLHVQNGQSKASKLIATSSPNIQSKEWWRASQDIFKFSLKVRDIPLKIQIFNSSQVKVLIFHLNFFQNCFSVFPNMLDNRSFIIVQYKVYLHH